MKNWYNNRRNHDVHDHSSCLCEVDVVPPHLAEPLFPDLLPGLAVGAVHHHRVRRRVGDRLQVGVDTLGKDIVRVGE